MMTSSATATAVRRRAAFPRNANAAAARYRKYATATHSDVRSVTRRARSVSLVLPNFVRRTSDFSLYRNVPPDRNVLRREAHLVVAGLHVHRARNGQRRP